MILLVTSSATAGAGATGGLTTIALIVIVILAVLVIAGMLFGAKQKRARMAGEQAERERSAAMTAAEPKAVEAAEPQPLAAPAPKVAEPAEPVAAKPPVAKTVAPATAEETKAAAPKPAKPKATKAQAPTDTPAAKPAPAKKSAAAKPAASAAAAQYGLIDVKGLGPKAVPLLEGLGITDLKALAGLSAARAAEIDGQLGVLSGRMARDRWVEQAKLLAAGKVAEFEAAFGKL